MRFFFQPSTPSQNFNSLLPYFFCSIWHPTCLQNGTLPDSISHESLPPGGWGYIEIYEVHFDVQAPMTLLCGGAYYFRD